MSRWFRVYDDLVDDPKVQRLSGDLVKALLNLWCLASKNDGILPSEEEIAFKLRMTLPRAARILDQLFEAGLIEKDETGSTHPHNWSGRQHKSDDSAERVRRFRAKKKPPPGSGGNSSVTVTVTPPDTEAETENREAASAACERARAPPKSSDLVELRTEIMQAFHDAGSVTLPDTSRAAVWLAQGYRPEIISPVVRGVLARKPDVLSLSYFDGPIRDAHAAPPPPRVLNGAHHHGPHRKPTVSDVLRARLAQLGPADDEPPLPAIGCH